MNFFVGFMFGAFFMFLFLGIAMIAKDEHTIEKRKRLEQRRNETGSPWNRQ
tara:strand:- start:364 stop:516 length:153 start_codon:yes stop_codon:yes gene_type:complete